MDLVDDDQGAVGQSPHLVFCVDEDEPLLCGELLASLEKLERNIAGLIESGLVNQSLLNNGASADGLVVNTHLGFRRRCDDQVIQSLVAFEPLGKGELIDAVSVGFDVAPK